MSNEKENKKPKKQPKFKQERKLWYRGLKNIVKIRYKKPEFIFLGEKPTNSSIILSNHVGTDGPMSLEIYAQFPIRMWGTYKMNSGLKNMYKYQSEVFYHEKKHWNLFGARMFCLIASPLTNLFYKGLNLISTYKDLRFKETLSQSLDAILNRKENVVIFPEDSTNGYQDELQGFYGGFVVLAQSLAKKGFDVPIFAAYYNKKENKYIFSEPIYFSELKENSEDRRDIAENLLKRCNNLVERERALHKSKEEEILAKSAIENNTQSKEEEKENANLDKSSLKVEN